MTKTLPDARFEVLARLSHRYAADVQDIADDCDLTAEALLDAFAWIICMNISLEFVDDGQGYVEAVQIGPDSWQRAKMAATAYFERTYRD